jgi:hypothetical protein
MALNGTNYLVAIAKLQNEALLIIGSDDLARASKRDA